MGAAVAAVYGSATNVDTNVLDSAVVLLKSVLPLTDGLVWAFVKYYMDMDDQGKGLEAASANKAQLQSWACQQCVVYLLLFAADALQICRTSATASGSGSAGNAAAPVMSDLEILQFSHWTNMRSCHARTRGCCSFLAVTLHLGCLLLCCCGSAWTCKRYKPGLLLMIRS